MFNKRNVKSGEAMYDRSIQKNTNFLTRFPPSYNCHSRSKTMKTNVTWLFSSINFISALF